MQPNPHYDLSDFLKPLQFNKFRLAEPDTFGILFKPDVSNFVKRIKYYINKDYIQNGEEKRANLRFFAVGEYGPKTFRPHYHVMFFLEDEEVAGKMPAYVRKAWPFGRIDCQLSTSGECAGYCAGYLNSYSHVPKVLRFAWNRPFVLHSPHYGERPFTSAIQDLQSLTFENVGRRSIVLDGVCREVGAPVSFQSYFFPKCFRYGSSNDYECLVRYTLYERCCESFIRFYGVPPLSVSQLCDDVFDAIDSGSTRYPYYVSRDWFVDSVTASLRDALYLQLLMSARFRMLCDTFNCSEWYYYHNIIKPFYDAKNMDLLKMQLRKMSEQADVFAHDAPWLVTQYGNLPVPEIETLEDYISMDLDLLCGFEKRQFSFFCWVAESFGVSYDRLIYMIKNAKESPLFMYDYEKQTRLNQARMKHKVLNDLNKIFL